MRVIYQPVGAGFVVDTPGGSFFVVDPSCSLREQQALAEELLDPHELAEVFPLLTA